MQLQHCIRRDGRTVYTDIRTSHNIPELFTMPVQYKLNKQSDEHKLACNMQMKMKTSSVCFLKWVLLLSLLHRSRQHVHKAQHTEPVGRPNIRIYSAKLIPQGTDCVTWFNFINTNIHITTLCIVMLTICRSINQRLLRFWGLRVNLPATGEENVWSDI